jgi:hypothetical protein
MTPKRALLTLVLELLTHKRTRTHSSAFLSQGSGTAALVSAQGLGKGSTAELLEQVISSGLSNPNLTSKAHILSPTGVRA